MDFLAEMRDHRQRNADRLRAHDLWEFWKEATRRIVDQYEKLRGRAPKHPNTTGDQGEIDWKQLLEQWIPSTYKIVNKGRLLFEDGTPSPELDVIVLKPAYPMALQEHKYYLADGVVRLLDYVEHPSAKLAESRTRRRFASASVVEGLCRFVKFAGFRFRPSRRTPAPLP
jgi:hypothetical protein